LGGPLLALDAETGGWVSLIGRNNPFVAIHGYRTIYFGLGAATNLGVMTNRPGESKAVILKHEIL